MLRSQVSELLSLAAAFDQRTIGPSDVEAWRLAISQVDYVRAKDAVVAHYRECDRRLMPADIVRLCRSAAQVAPFAAQARRPDQDAVNARGKLLALEVLAGCRGPMVEGVRGTLEETDA